VVTSIPCQRVRDQIQLLRDRPQLPFADLLEAETVAEAVAAEGVLGRTRIFTPLITVWTFLSQILSPDHSCREAVSRLIGYLIALGRRPCEPTTDAYCRARQRLPLGVVQRLARHTADTLQAAVPNQWLWKGLQVYLVDGTTVSMPDTPDNQRAFPQARSQQPGCGFPVARLVAIISLATGAVRDLAMGPYKGKETGETALLRRLWQTFNQGDLVLGDRYFASFFGLAGLHARRVDTLTRMHQRRCIDFRRGRRLGVADHVVNWSKPQRPVWMDQATYDAMPDQLTIRELKIRIDVPGFRIQDLALATNLLDDDAYGKDELADLYLQRWHVELDLRSIKVVMQMDVLRCKSAEMVEKEVWMHALAYNLIRGLMAAAADEHAANPRRISFKGTLQALLAFRDRLLHTTVAGRLLLLAELLKTIAAQTVGDRPNRIEPRRVKRRHKPISLLMEPRAKARKRLTRNH
jgi:Transposase DDE domain